MPDFILEYDDLESIAKYSKSLGKQAKEYAESLDSKVKSRIENVSGPSTGNLMNASDLVNDKIIALNQKADAFYHFAEQITNLLEVAERIDQEVADTIKGQGEYFLEHHESLRLEKWKVKLLDLLVDMKNSNPLLETIGDILKSVDAILNPSKDTIKHWYQKQGKRESGPEWDGNLDWEFIYGKTNLWKFPDLKNIKENGNVNLKNSIKQEYKKSANNIQGTDVFDWIGNSYYDNWLNRPAKKDIFDKLIDYVDKKLFGIELREKTQADQFFSGCFFGLQFDQQQAVNEFSETMTSTMKNAASYDLEIESESFPVNSIPAMASNRVNSTEGSGQSINPNEIRFSQSSVNGSEKIIDSMKKNGWVGDPIDVVQIPDGNFTTIDNTRVAAARQAGIDVQANMHSYSESLPNDLIERFTTKKGIPITWGDAFELRIGKQNVAFRNTYPSGSFDMPKLK